MPTAKYYRFELVGQEDSASFELKLLHLGCKQDTHFEYSCGCNFAAPPKTNVIVSRTKFVASFMCAMTKFFKAWFKILTFG